MPMAYVLLTTEIGAEREVVKVLRKIEGVQEAFNLAGVYDIIARVKADTMAKLSQIISEQLQISRVQSKLTGMVTEA